MKKRLLALFLVFAMLLPVFSMGAFADSDEAGGTTNSVTVYFSVTDDASFMDGMSAGTYVLAMPGQKGITDTENISCTPGCLRLVIQ